MHSSMTGPRVADRVERLDPGGPVDRAVAGREVDVLPAVVVVDVRRREERPAARVSAAAAATRWAWPVSSARPSSGMVQLGDELGEVGHPAAGVDARRHVLDADGDAGPARVVGERERGRRARAARRSSASSGRRGRRGGRRGRCPRPPASQSTQRLRSSTDARAPRVRSSRGRRGGADRLAAPAAVGAVDRQARDRRPGGGARRVGEGAPVGRISRTLAPSRAARARSRRGRPRGSRRRPSCRALRASRRYRHGRPNPRSLTQANPLVGSAGGSHDSGYEGRHRQPERRTLRT